MKTLRVFFVVAVERPHQEAGLSPCLRCFELTCSGHSFHTMQKVHTMQKCTRQRAAGSERVVNVVRGRSPGSAHHVGTITYRAIDLLILGRTSAHQQRSARSQCRAPEMRDKRGASAVPEHSPGTKQSLHVTCEAIHQRAPNIAVYITSSVRPICMQSLSAPSAERDATCVRRCKASCGATVNCCSHKSSNRRSRQLAEAFHPLESSASRASN